MSACQVYVDTLAYHLPSTSRAKFKVCCSDNLTNRFLDLAGLATILAVGPGNNLSVFGAEGDFAGDYRLKRTKRR
jgi:hypothetical protein